MSKTPAQQWAALKKKLVRSIKTRATQARNEAAALEAFAQSCPSARRAGMMNAVRDPREHAAVAEEQLKVLNGEKVDKFESALNLSVQPNPRWTSR
jgi:hypothetical protein